MNKIVEKLVQFIEKYGEDYLNDGSKKTVLQRLKDGDERLALDIMKSMSPEWVERAKEIGSFRIFTDNVALGFIEASSFNKPYYTTSFMDNFKDEKDIPTLKYIIPKKIGKENIDNYIGR